MAKMQEGGDAKKGILQIIFGRTMIIIFLLVIQFLYLFGIMFAFSEKLPYISGITGITTGIVLLFVLNTKDDPTIKLSWCILIAILPVFGTLLYLYIKYDLGHRVEKKVFTDTVSECSTYVAAQDELLEKIKGKEPDLYSTATYLKKCAGGVVCQNTSVMYFPLGEDKFDELLNQLERAEKFIFLEYFIIDKGYMWSRILDVLERKASQGVDVRVMYDGTCAVFLLPYNYPKILGKKGIKCKMFSPLRPLVSTHYNNRDHRKIVVIDGHTAFTGGINLADEYINRIIRHGHWKDTAIMVKGEAAQQFTLMFLQMWNTTEREHVYEPFVSISAPDKHATGYVIPYGSTPHGEERVGEMVYMNILNQTKDYVYIMTPYLILDNQMLTAMQFAVKRGVDVRLIVPHISDHKYTEILAKKHYRELYDAGVKIFEYTPGFVHAKVFLSDNKKAVVGTINMDYRSLYLHYECAAYLYNAPVIDDIYKDFENTLSKCHLITDEDIKKQSLFIKIAGFFLKLAAPLM